MKFFAALLAAGVLLFTAGAVYADHIDDFSYNLPVCATNDSETALATVPLVATVNADQLSDGGFTQDWTDLIAVNPNGDHAALFAQDTASEDARWWVEMDSLAAGQTRCWEVHLGSATATRDQPVFLVNASESVDVPDAASLDVTGNLTLEALGVNFRDLPGSSGTYLVGGSTTEVNGYRVHTFTSGGTLSVVEPGTVSYLVVGGGGQGGATSSGCNCSGGGGGAGEVQYGSVTIDAAQTITVGAGGSSGGGGDVGESGNPSSIGALVTALGGGGGGGQTSAGGLDGGSGGGGSGTSSGGGLGGSAVGTGDGNDGADGVTGAGDGRGGGGGGASAAGLGMTGGAGDTYSVPTGDRTVGGGGGGGNGDGTGGSGGVGGGGGGGSEEDTGDPVAGTANTGGGGGGGAFDFGVTRGAADGGSGLVIVWYEVPERACLICKENAYTLGVMEDTAFATLNIGASGFAVSAASVSADVEVDLKATYDGSTLALFVDGATAATDSASGSISTNAATATIDSFIGEVGRVRIGGTSIASPTYVLDLGFEPDECTQTQEGSSGNDWTWTGTCADQSASGNDATYTFVRSYMADVATNAEALIAKASLPTVLVTGEVEDVTGTLPDPDETLDPEDFPGRGSIGDAIAFIGGPVDAGWFAGFAAIGILLGMLVAGLVKFDAAGMFTLGTVVGIGGLFGLYSIGLVVITAVGCFAIGGGLAVAGVGRRR